MSSKKLSCNPIMSITVSDKRFNFSPVYDFRKLLYILHPLQQNYFRFLQKSVAQDVARFLLS